jgi:hypothetical protein
MAARRTEGCSAAPARRRAKRVGPRPRLTRRPPGRARPDLATTALVRRPYDLWHAALSWWLNANAEPAEVAARAGNSARVLYDTYLHCIGGKEDLVSQRIEDALDADLGSRPPSQCVKTSGCTHRRHYPGPCPPYIRRSPAEPPTAHELTPR